MDKKSKTMYIDFVHDLELAKKKKKRKP